MDTVGGGPRRIQRVRACSRTARTVSNGERHRRQRSTNTPVTQFTAGRASCWWRPARHTSRRRRSTRGRARFPAAIRCPVRKIAGRQPPPVTIHRQIEARHRRCDGETVRCDHRRQAEHAEDVEELCDDVAHGDVALAAQAGITGRRTSGSVVPAATIVRPITSSLTPRLCATATAAVTNQRGPEHERAQPTNARSTFVTRPRNRAGGSNSDAVLPLDCCGLAWLRGRQRPCRTRCPRQERALEPRHPASMLIAPANEPPIINGRPGGRVLATANGTISADSPE